MQVDWRQHIVSIPEVIRGRPRIQGTRIPVSLILGYLAAGKTTSEIIEEFPDLTTEQTIACLDYARALSEFEEESTMTTSKERARLIPGEAPTELRFATLSVRPLRLAFLINAESSEDELLKYITYNTSIWGGFSNFFIPLHSSTITDDWLHALRRYDPDKVILCNKVGTMVYEDVSDQIQPFCVMEWSDKVMETHYHSFDKFGSVPLRYIMRYIYDQERPIEQPYIRIPKCPEGSPFRFCMAAQFGELEESLFKIYTQPFKAESVEFSDGSLEVYLECISRFEGRLSPLNVTEYGLSSWTDDPGGILGASLMVLGDGALAEDFCVFWNLRASDRGITKGISLLLPYSIFSAEDNLYALGKWCNEHVTWTNCLTLVSSSIGAERLIELRDKFRPFLSKKFRFIDLWHRQFPFGRFRMHEPEIREEIRLTGRTFSLRVPKPGWWERSRSGMEWVVDLDLQDRSRLYAGFGYIPPRFPGLNHLLAGKPDRVFGGYSLRSAYKHLSLRVHKSTEYVAITLPEDEQLFQALLDDKGYRSEITDKCLYAKGMIRLLGSYSEAKILQDFAIRELLYAMHKKGNAFTVDGMKQFLRPGNEAAQHQNTESLIADLSLKGIFLRGYLLQCPACDLSRWYSLDEIAEKMQCAGCLTKMQPPIDALFHYRLNELFIRGIEQGAMSLLLTILILFRLSHESYLFVPGLEVTKHNSNSVDLDILAACDGYLVVAESKDLQKGCTPETVEELVSQLHEVVRVAQDIGARIVILSALLEEAPKELVDAIEDMRQQYPYLGIHLALREDLERGYLASERADKPAMVQNLLPKQPAGESGRIGEPGERFGSFF